MIRFRKSCLTIEELQANHQMVSVHKYGFFLCLSGTIRFLLGKEQYRLSKGSLCIYAPNTLFQILERSDDLTGILEEDVVDAYLPIVSAIDIHKRLQIRHAPCCQVSETQMEAIVRLENVIQAEQNEQCIRYLRYAMCLKVLEIYFCNKPMEAMAQDRDDRIVNLFIEQLYAHFHHERTVQFYADLQHLSPYYFSTIIKSRSGKSAMQWIETVTMTFARQYLVNSELNLKQIADRLHFSDQSTFGRYFKQREGCSPSMYRNKSYQKQ